MVIGNLLGDLFEVVDGEFACRTGLVSSPELGKIGNFLGFPIEHFGLDAPVRGEDALQQKSAGETEDGNLGEDNSVHNVVTKVDNPFGNAQAAGKAFDALGGHPGLELVDQKI